MSLTDLRVRLKSGEKSFLGKYSDRVAVLERWRPWFAVGAVLGALIAAVARLFEGGWGIGLTVGGAVFAATCGALVALMDFKKLEISQEAMDAHSIADDALIELEAREADLAQSNQRAAAALSEAESFDKRRLSRIEAVRLMVETIEAALITSATTEKSAERLLKVAAARIRSAVDYRTGDFFTLTIFKREARDPAEGERMHPIAREWTDPGAAVGGRSWAKGEGYTGVLWSLAADNSKASVVEPDTSLPGVAERYPVSNPNAAREARYRSVVAFGITVGKSNEVWGVVTATSDRAGVFDHRGDLARQSVETVRDVALAAGLLVKLDRPVA